jgi:YidC/Oxa1 family membrane protein insertase
MQSRNHLIFFIVVLLLIATWWVASKYFLSDKSEEKPASTRRSEEGTKPAAAEPGRLPTLPEATPDRDLLALGEKDPDSKWNIFAQFDPLGGGVRSVWLNKFKAANDDGRPTGEMLELVPGEANRQVPAFLVYAFNPENPSADHPLDTLGRKKWEVVKKAGKAIVEDETENGLARQQVSFRTTAHGVTITKTYTLIEGDYHLGLTIDLERPEAGPDAGSKEKKAIPFRYQLAGAKGLFVEGKWYTSVFRNAYIAHSTDSGSVSRDLQTLKEISVWAGGNNVEREPDKFIRYAAVAVQYFASAIVVDNEQEGDQDQTFIKRARPTLERGVAKGTIKKIRKADDGKTLVVVIVDKDGKNEETVFVPPDLNKEAGDLREDQTVAVISRVGSYDRARRDSPRLAEEVRVGTDAVESTQSLWEDDITVRVSTEPIDMKPGTRVTHRYLLYHGPIKPSLLSYLRGDRKVDEKLIARYDELGLNKMTDYPSSGWMGNIGRYTGFTYVVIFFTNKMHWLLGLLGSFIPSYGLCIILLTVMVRGLMFPLSRRQALMSIKMQALAPEVKKLAEKYKDDQQALGKAQMELWKKHGVNPLGSCWVLLLQMPIFMGLYYALQESIQFRLASFWTDVIPWPVNLAAPDMLLYWGRDLPLLSWVSSDAHYGGFLYLGPYLNILPVIAVTLMILQQKFMTPPAADEQQKMQQKMMKYMMVIFGLMFYKVAAGLCIYFISSSLWGFAERKLLPRAKPAQPGAEPDRESPPAAGGKTDQITAAKPAGTSAAVTGGPSGKKKKGKDRNRSKAKEEPTRLASMRQRLSDWWSDLLKKAGK